MRRALACLGPSVVPLALVLAACGADTSGIPCSSKADCPNGEYCKVQNTSTGVCVAGAIDATVTPAEAGVDAGIDLGIDQGIDQGIDAAIDQGIDAPPPDATPDVPIAGTGDGSIRPGLEGGTGHIDAATRADTLRCVTDLDCGDGLVCLKNTCTTCTTSTECAGYDSSAGGVYVCDLSTGGATSGKCIPSTTCPAPGSTLYANVTAGSDSGSGSLSCPTATLTHAESLVSGSTTEIDVWPGIYTDSASSGGPTETFPITLNAGVTVTVDPRAPKGSFVNLVESAAGSACPDVKSFGCELYEGSGGAMLMGFIVLDEIAGSRAIVFNGTADGGTLLEEDGFLGVPPPGGAPTLAAGISVENSASIGTPPSSLSGFVPGLAGVVVGNALVGLDVAGASHVTATALYSGLSIDPTKGETAYRNAIGVNISSGTLSVQPVDATSWSCVGNATAAAGTAPGATGIRISGGQLDTYPDAATSTPPLFVGVCPNPYVTGNPFIVVPNGTGIDISGASGASLNYCGIAGNTGDGLYAHPDGGVSPTVNATGSSFVSNGGNGVRTTVALNLDGTGGANTFGGTSAGGTSLANKVSGVCLLLGSSSVPATVKANGDAWNTCPQKTTEASTCAAGYDITAPIGCVPGTSCVVYSTCM